MQSISPEYPSLYVDFFYYFNIEKDYYECHEVLEELWLSTGRERFYQGLLQVAVALHHHRNENINGAIKMLTAALDKLANYPESPYMGIDLQHVKEESDQILQRLLMDPATPFTPFEIRIIDGTLATLIHAKQAAKQSE